MTANQIIQKHYQLKRPVTDEEVVHELVNLRRKRKKGNLNDTQERLVAELESRGMFSNADRAAFVQVPVMGIPPQGYQYVNEGEVREGDLLWTPETRQWEAAEGMEVGSLVTSFKAVVRKS